MDTAAWSAVRLTQQKDANQMPYRFVDKTRTMIVHEESGQVLEWNPAAGKIVSDHGHAARRIATPARRSRYPRLWWSRPMTPIGAAAAAQATIHRGGTDDD